MRILLANDSIDTVGGVEAYLAALVPALQARGHEVALLCHDAPRAPVDLQARSSLCVCVAREGLGRATERVQRWLPDVCISHNMAPLEVDRSLLREWPVIKMMHGYLGTCVSGLKTHAFPGTRACTRSFGPTCLALYFPRHCGELNPVQVTRSYRWALEQRSLFDRYTAVVVASRHMRDEYVLNGVPAERIHLLPLFSTLDEEPATRAPERDTVLFAARMTTLKGGHVLVAAAAAAARRLGRPVPLVMVGDGPQAGEWRALADRLGVPADFTGWLPAATRRDVYRRAALLAVPSLWPEPFGLIGLEAASLGIPAVAFDVGGVREWLSGGRSGVLVDPAAGSDGLATAIAGLLSDPNELGRLGAGARATAQRMSAHAHLDRLEALLSDICRTAIPA